MKTMNLFVFPMLALVGVAVAAVVPSKHGRDYSVHHRDLANRTDENTHWKRVSNSRWTFYDVGLGACGKTNVPSDFIVALNSAQFGSGYPGPHCFKKIKMTYKGKTTTAQITDECPGCPYGGLDLSRGLFDFFASEDLGVITGSWSFDDGGDDGDNGGENNSPKSTTTTKPHTTAEDRPTTTSEHTSSKQHPPTTTTSEAPTPTSTPTESPVTTSTEPSATSTADGNPANLKQFVSLLDALGGLVVAGSQLD